MEFEMTADVLQGLLKQAGCSRPRKSEAFKLTASGGRVSVEFRGVIAGTIVPIKSEGSVSLPAKNFRAVLETYGGKGELEFSGNEKYFQIENLKMPVLSWSSGPTYSP